MAVDEVAAQGDTVSQRRFANATALLHLREYSKRDIICLAVDVLRVRFSQRTKPVRRYSERSAPGRRRRFVAVGRPAISERGALYAADAL